MTKPKETPTRGLMISGERRRHPQTALDASGARPSGATIEPEMRASLELAQTSGDCVAVALRGDLERGIPMRVIEGVVMGFDAAADGRPRVRLAIGADAEQVVLLERVVRVLPAG